MLNAVPARHNHLQHRQMITVVAASAAAAFSLGLILSHLDSKEMTAGLPRTAVAVAGVALVLALVEIRLARQMARIEAGLQEHLAHIEQCLERQLALRVKEDFAEDYLKDLQRRQSDGEDGPFLRSV